MLAGGIEQLLLEGLQLRFAGGGAQGVVEGGQWRQAGGLGEALRWAIRQHSG
ncbi:hypothetical protein D3C85_1311890 [compost metagenome]